MNPQTYKPNPQVVYYGGAQPTAAATSNAQIILGSSRRSDQPPQAGSQVFYAPGAQNPMQYQEEYQTPHESASSQVFTVGSTFQSRGQTQFQPHMQSSSAQFSPSMMNRPQQGSLQSDYTPAQQSIQGGYNPAKQGQQASYNLAQQNQQCNYNPDQNSPYDNYDSVPSQTQSKMAYGNQQGFSEYQNMPQNQFMNYGIQPQTSTVNQPRYTSTTLIGGPQSTAIHAVKQNDGGYTDEQISRTVYTQQSLAQPLRGQGNFAQPQTQQIYRPQQPQQTNEVIQYQNECETIMDIRPTTQQKIQKPIDESREMQAPKMRELQPRQRQSLERSEDAGPPQFITHPVSQITVTEGEGCTIKAVIQPAGDPTLAVKWLKSGSVLNASSRSYASMDRGYATFQILYTNSTDSGEYCCIATNSQGQAQSMCCKLTIILEAGVITHTQLPEESMINNINAMDFYMSNPEIAERQEEKQFDQVPTFLRQLLPQLNIKENDRAKFETFVQPANDSTLMMEWYKDGKILNTGCRFTTTMDRGFAILDIHYCYAEDTGDYMCVAKNSAGRTQSNVVQLTCKPGAAIVTDSVLSDASISYLQSLDSCTGTDATKYDQRYQELEETLSAPTFEITPNEAVVIEGSPIRLLVKAGGYPRPSVKWFINGDWLPQSSNGGAWSIYNDGGISYLEMHRAGPPGEYQVTVAAENNLGKVTTQTNLVIDPLPDFRPDLKHIAPENPFRKMGQLKHVQRMPELDNAFSRRRPNALEFKKLERKSTLQSTEAIETQNLYNQTQSSLRTSRKIQIPSGENQQVSEIQNQQIQSMKKTQRGEGELQINSSPLLQSQNMLQQKQPNLLSQTQRSIHLQPENSRRQNSSNQQQEDLIGSQMKQQQPQAQQNTRPFQVQMQQQNIGNKQENQIKMNSWQQPTDQAKTQVIQQPYNPNQSDAPYQIQTTQIQKSFIPQSFSEMRQPEQLLMDNVVDQQMSLQEQQMHQQNLEQQHLTQDKRNFEGQQRQKLSMEQEQRRREQEQIIGEQKQRQSWEHQIKSDGDRRMIEQEQSQKQSELQEIDMIKNVQGSKHGIEDRRNIMEINEAEQAHEHEQRAHEVEYLTEQSQPEYFGVKETTQTASGHIHSNV